VFGSKDSGVQGVELAEFAAAGEFDGEAEIIDIAALGAGLIDTRVEQDGLVEFLAFLQGHGTGFFRIDVLAGLGGEDRAECVPAVAGGDEHGVDVIAVKDLPHVAMGLAVLVAVVAVDGFADNLAARLLHVRNGDEADIRVGEEGSEHLAATRADADAAEDDLVAGCDIAVSAKDAGRNDGWHCGDPCRLPDETSAGGLCGHEFWVAGIVC
jgi:hypothetical protein